MADRTPSERERRIEAGMRAWLPLGSPPLTRRTVASVLDAADEAVPVVPARKLAEVEAAARAVLPLLGMGPAQGFSAEPYRAKARLALVLDESDSPSFSGEEGTEPSDAGERR